MRKVLLSFLIGCLGFISGQASTIVSQDWVPGPILGGNNGSTNDGRPLTQSYIKTHTTVDYNPNLSALVISIPDVQGHIYAIFQPQPSVKPRIIQLAPGGDTVIPINTWSLDVQRLVVVFGSSEPILILDVLFYIDNGMLYYCEEE
jgi:hypothetical protein